MASWLDAAEVNVPGLRVSLRISGDGLDPEFLTQQFGVAPSFSARKGESIVRNGRASVQKTGAWVYRLDAPPAIELGEAIGLLLEVFPEDTTLWGEIASAYSADVFCGIFLQDDNQSTAISPDILTALGRRGLLLTLDCYAPSGADRDPAA